MLAGWDEAVNTSFFSEMLQSIADRSRALIKRERREPAHERSAGIVEQCEELLSGRGEASGVALAQDILAEYADLTTGPRIAFFEALATTFGHDRARIDRAIAEWRQSPTADNAAELHHARAPRRWSACASNCSTPWRIATSSAWSTMISFTCSRRGSIAVFWCCAASTGR